MKSYFKLLNRIIIVAALSLQGALTPSLVAGELILQNGLNGYEGAESTTLHGLKAEQMTASFGKAAILGAAGVKGGGFKQLGLLRFRNISGHESGRIPPGTVISNARLELYKLDEPRDSGQYAQMPKEHAELRVFRMLTDWKAGEAQGVEEPGTSCYSYRYFDAEQPVFWGNAHSIEEGPVRNIDFQFTPRSASPLIPGGSPAWMSWDVTSMVQEWLNEPEKNFGVTINALGYWVGAFFASCSHEDASLRPRLIIEY